MIEGIPLPATDDPVDAPYWAAALRSELVIQCCEQCQRLRFPPRPMCPDCQSSQHRWHTVCGRARIWSFAAPSSPLLPAFEQLTPYVSALAELEDHPHIRIVGPVLTQADGEIKGVEPQQLSIGQAVTVAFKKLADDVALPCWVVDSSDA